MRKFIKELIYRKFNVSFSKSGDDIQLHKLINNQVAGVYVDIGCWHPIKASNTYFFYLRGWKGLCIDPNPDLKELYEYIRPKDKFINCAIGDKDEIVKYYLLNDNYSSMNTLNYNFLKIQNLENQIKKVIDIPLFSLKDVLNKNISDGDRLDFFDIDVEGFNFEVIKSNDWHKYRPKIIVIESDQRIKDDLNSEIVQYLDEVSYRLIAKSIVKGDLGNLFFINNQL